MDSNSEAGKVSVYDDIVFCQGSGPSGHPGIFLNLGPQGTVHCPYCGQRFARAQDAKSDQSVRT